jgi:glycosyltransferase involved in cell wall biosynthesis
MKSAFLSVFYPYRGGISQYNSLLYDALKQRNETNAYNFSRQYPQILFPGSSQYVTENDSQIKTPSERVLDSINPFSYFKTARQIAKKSPDLLLMGYWMPFLAPCLGFVAKRLRKKGVKVVSVLHNVKPHEKRFGDRQLSRYFLKQNDAFVVMSKAVRDDLLSFIPDAKYILHPFPIYSQFGDRMDKIEARKRLKIPLDKKVLLFFGLIRDYKGLDLVIEAFNKLSDEYYLVIAGESYGKFDAYQKQIDTNNNKERIVQHIKYIADDEVSCFISAADLNVLPYKTATQSAVVALAYQFDSPVLVTDVGGLKDMVEPYGTGVVVDGPESSLIANGIELFFNQNMEESCKTSIRKFKLDYSWDNLAKEIEDLYHTL